MKNPEFDSNEEEWMYWWFKELEEKGYVHLFETQPFSYPLFEKLSVDYFEPYKKKSGGKNVSEPIISDHKYTPDGIVWWDESAIGLFTELIDGNARKRKGQSLMKMLCQKADPIHEGAPDQYYSIIEVKPTFDRFNMTRIAKLHLQWVYQKHGDFINIVSPKTYFPKSFTPKKYMITKTNKARKIPYKNVVTLEEFINQNK